MHMASGISLVTSIGKFPDMKAHIVLKLPFLSHDDVLRNLDNVIDLTHVTPSIRDHLGYVLQGRPRNCASFVRLLISKNRSIGETKNQVLQKLIPLWFCNICFDMTKYLEIACGYIRKRISPEKAIMDVLRLHVFYNHNYTEAIKLLQHSIIPCKSPECIVLGSEDEISDKIEINPSLESYIIDSIVLYLKKTQRKIIDVFVSNIIMLNNISSIGNEFDATDKVMEQLMKSCLRFQYMECPRKRKKDDEEFSFRKPKRLQIGLGNNNLPYGFTANEEGNLERREKERKKEKKKEKKDSNYDLNYIENTKNYRISRVPDHANYHKQIKNSIENQRHICISVELPYREGKSPELFRFNEYGDLVIVVDDRNMEYVFGPVINKLMKFATNAF
ncbi:hypothetical protein RhiirA4_550583 [Rhizophagus irregularis]|uniref:Uncharacterized protein n=1 Tax=Rhizophagus irregularis TaxID=588596 RepID=A0A2I1HMX6_9GLOM|nr:hypothetical protein RhiirA4_550583 [Rhizophagus irregularis]